MISHPSTSPYQNANKVSIFPIAKPPNTPWKGKDFPKERRGQYYCLDCGSPSLALCRGCGREGWRWCEFCCVYKTRNHVREHTRKIKGNQARVGETIAARIMRIQKKKEREERIIAARKEELVDLESFYLEVVFRNQNFDYSNGLVFEEELLSLNTGKRKRDDSMRKVFSIGDIFQPLRKKRKLD